MNYFTYCNILTHRSPTWTLYYSSDLTLSQKCNPFKQWQRSFQWKLRSHWQKHYSDVIMSAIASQITSLTIVYLTSYSGADQRKHQSSASLAFVRGIHRSPVNSAHKGPVTRKIFPFDDVIMILRQCRCRSSNTEPSAAYTASKSGVISGPGNGL